jgi:hypothetical protein
LLSFAELTHRYFFLSPPHPSARHVGFKIQFLILEIIFVALIVAAVPIGAHGTVVGVCISNLLLLAWFWYNLVRSVDVTADGSLRFWIGNIEVDVPFDKIVGIRRVATSMPCSIMVTAQPYRGFLATPTDGVAIVTTVPSTPFWLWPRSAGKPDRTCCFGALSCPRLTVVFSPAGAYWSCEIFSAYPRSPVTDSLLDFHSVFVSGMTYCFWLGGGLNFIREVETEMRNFQNAGSLSAARNNNHNNGATVTTRTSNPDYLDV